MLDGTEPEWVVREFDVEVINEFRGVRVWDGDVLDDVFGGETRLVQGVVHDACVHEVVEEETRDAVEGGEKVFVCVAGDPETAAVVTEEVGLQWDVFCYRGVG